MEQCKLRVHVCAMMGTNHGCVQGLQVVCTNCVLCFGLQVKQSMKRHKSNKTLQRVFHSRQLGLKLIANVTYGYTAANFSGRMPCIEVMWIWWSVPLSVWCQAICPWNTWRELYLSLKSFWYWISLVTKKEKYFIPVCSLVSVLFSCYAIMHCDVCIVIWAAGVQFCIHIDAVLCYHV